MAETKLTSDETLVKPTPLPVIAHEPKEDMTESPIRQQESTQDETTDEDSHRDPGEQEFPTLGEMEVRPGQDIIICSAKLPISVRKINEEWTVEPGNSVIISALYNCRRRAAYSTGSHIDDILARATWIGHPGVFPKSEQERSQIEKLLRPYNCIPLFID